MRRRGRFPDQDRQRDRPLNKDSTGRVQKARQGLYKCTQKACRQQFSVTVGTVFERSHIPLSKWLMAAYLLCSSKKGFSAHQLHRTLDVTYKTAWFLAHRIRHAMASPAGLLGSGGAIVEADETYIGRKSGNSSAGRPWPQAHGVSPWWSVAAKSAQRTSSPSARAKTTRRASKNSSGYKDLSLDANVMTDDARWYRNIVLPLRIA